LHRLGVFSFLRRQDIHTTPRLGPSKCRPLPLLLLGRRRPTWSA
jgi:hypothetical protein